MGFFNWENVTLGRKIELYKVKTDVLMKKIRYNKTKY